MPRVKHIVRGGLGLFALAAVAHLFFAPTPVEPVAWTAPADAGFTASFSANRALAARDRAFSLGHAGPEDVTVGPDGATYWSTASGVIARREADSDRVSTYCKTGGRPLGLTFDREGVLWIADAQRGLLSYRAGAEVRVRSDQADGTQITFANSLDIDDDGVVYFTDASTKFGAKAFGGPLPASEYDILEHGGYGRLLSYEPKSGKTRVLLRGLQFANGLVISHDRGSLLVAETGLYRVSRYHLRGSKRGQRETLLDNLPGFPDNLSRSPKGYWLGLVAPRLAVVDRLSAWPELRKVAERLPHLLRPKARPYAHVVEFDDKGAILRNLQDPEGELRLTSGAEQVGKTLYITSLDRAARYMLD